MSKIYDKATIPSISHTRDSSRLSLSESSARFSEHLLAANQHTAPALTVPNSSPYNPGGFVLYIDKDGNLVCGMPPFPATPSGPVKEPFPPHSPPIPEDVKDPGYTLPPTHDGSAKIHGPTLPPTPVTDSPVHLPYGKDPLVPLAPSEKVHNDGSTTHDVHPTTIGMPLDDGGFTVYLDKDGNAVCGTPPSPIQTAIDSFVSGGHSPATPAPHADTASVSPAHAPSFADIHGHFDVPVNSDTV